MRLRIAAVGKMRPGPEATLMERYLERLPWPCEVKEVTAKAREAQAARREEGRLLLEALKPCRAVVALDEHGKTVTSRDLAELIKRFAEDGRDRIGFVLGGADGLAPEVLARAEATLAFGRATWPHMLARVLLAEQLYRAYTLLTSHPYHRD